MALHCPEMKLSCRTSVGHMNPPLRRPSSKVLPIMSVRCFSSPPAAGVFSVVSASHLHTSTPWLMFPPEIDPTTNRKVDRFYSFTEKQVLKLDRKEILKVPEDARCFGASRGWLGFIDPNDCSLYLSNPFRDAPLVRLPSIETLPNVVGIRRKPSSTIIDEFIVERDMVGHEEECGTNYYEFMGPESLSASIAQHLTLLSGDIFREKEDCIVFLHTKTTGLALCRVGSDDSWTLFQHWNQLDECYGSCIACPLNDGDEKLSFYSMHSDFMSRLYFDGRYGYSYPDDDLDVDIIRAWEVLEPEKRTPKMCADFKHFQGFRNLPNGITFENSEHQYLKKLWRTEEYLGADKSSGDIMLVIKHTLEDATRFEVYKVDKREQKLKRSKFLGDRVILLNGKQCFIFSACEFPGFKPNSIYFENCLGIYNLEDNSIEPYALFSDELLKDETMWPPLFWVSPIL